MTSTPEQQLDQLQRAALAIKRLRTRVDTLEHQRSEPLAIIGLGCRLPGAAENLCGPGDFWRLLCAGEDAIREVPPERWDADRCSDPGPDAPGKSAGRWGSFLRGIDLFDAQLFGIAPREAVSMDPQQRLLLEVAWEALEHAGQAPDSLKQSGTGVFVGIGIGDYANMLLRPERRAAIDAYTGTGGGFCFASGRLSYILGAQGPSMSVDTACSSSLVALHLACQSLRAQECRMALAGGVNAMLSPEAMLFLAKSRALSPTGRCRTFDAAADGFVRGEGCGLLVLKRLSDAQADGDTVLALICGSAVNHDGPSSGLTVPNAQAQQALLRQALEQARLRPDQVDYVEAHGTGTPLGDPIELRALGAVLGQGRAPDAPLLVGSVKTNIGHLEAAAGVAGVIKVVLALQHGLIPPNLHFRTPSPHIPWDELAVAVPTAPQPWRPGPQRRRVAGVSSFGLSGTNAHVLLAEAPARDAAGAEPEGGPQALVLSARSGPALRELAERYERHLAANPALDLADLCFTANTGRASLGHSLAALADTPERLRGRLADFAAGRAAEGLFCGGERDGRPRLAFLFSGQGAQYAGMGRRLYAAQPVFRAALDRCAELLAPELGLDIRPLIFSDEPAAEHQAPRTADPGQTVDPTEAVAGSGFSAPDGPARSLEQTWLTQPALFALEYGLAELWRAWGVQPDVVLGHSLGEYVAACVAGVFSLEDALRLVVARARLMQALPAGGAMLAVFAGQQQVCAALRPYGEDVVVAALNGPDHVVVSGRRAALEELAGRFAAQGLITRWLEVAHAFHSPLMRPVQEDFARTARTVRYAPPRIELIANLTGAPETARVATPEYWVEHILRPVLFEAGMQTLRQRGCGICVEIGPRPVLLGMGRRCLPDGEMPWLWLPSLRPSRLADEAQMLESLAALCAHGVRADWRGFYQGRPRRRVALPTYPFQRQRFWAAPAREPAAQLQTGPPGRRVHSPAFTRGEIQFELLLDRHTPGLRHDPSSGRLALTGALAATLALAAGAQALGLEHVALEHVALAEELDFPADETRALQTLLVPAGLGASFQVLSQAEEPGGEGWRLHASGTLGPPEPADVQPPELAPLQTAIGLETAPAERELGPGAVVEQIGRRGEELLCRIALADASAYPHRLHPDLLDRCLQLVQGCDGAPPARLGQIGRLVLARRAGERVWCYARGADAWLFDEAGAPLAEIAGLLPRPGAEGARAAWERWLYQTVWRPADAGRGPLPYPVGAWLILADQGGSGRELAAALRARGARCILAYAGPGFGQTAPDEYRAAPDSAADVARLVDACAGIPLSGALYLWGLDTGAAAADPYEALLSTCVGALHLVQALVRAGGPPPPRLWLATRGAQPAGAHGLPHPHLAAVWGFGQAVALEHPELRCTCLDLDPAVPAGGAAALLAELAAPDDERRVALRGGQRLLARLERVPRGPRDVAAAPVRADASYLISGGLGGLGLRTARWLAEQGAGGLALLGRRPPTPEARRAVAELERAGARVLVLQTDVADAGALAAALEQIAETLPPLCGVIHAAGTLDDAPVGQQSRQRFGRVLAPKAAGAWNLHTLTGGLALEFFVCFSSAAAVLGSPGQSNYAAANAFLDGLAHHRRGLGLPATSVNWGPWAEVGMEAASRQRRGAQGLGMIEPAEGLRALGALIGVGPAQVCVLSARWDLLLDTLGDPDPFLAALRPRGAAQVQRQPGFAEQLAGLPAGERRAWLVHQLRALAAQALGAASPEQIAPREGLFEQGLDSLMAIELKRRLERRLGLELRQTFVFDYPMIDAMVDYLTREVLAGLFAQPSLPAEAPDADLALLSDAEAEALLLATLEQMNR